MENNLKLLREFANIIGDGEPIRGDLISKEWVKEKQARNALRLELRAALSRLGDTYFPQSCICHHRFRDHSYENDPPACYVLGCKCAGYQQEEHEG